MDVPVADPGAENAAVEIELGAALARVVASGTYVLGPEVEAFEREFAAFVGAARAVGVGSGTDALTLALTACGVGAGDEVITVSHSAGATAAGIIRAGATPVLVDVEPTSLTIDPEAVRRALTPATRAIVPVHLYGGAADLAPIWALAATHGLVVVEDCAQAHGARYRGDHVGSGSDAGAFSFYPTKNLAGLGDGGAVVTSSPEVADRLVALRQYGWRTPQVSTVLGWNSRLDELQAAALRVKLRHLPSFVATRRAAAHAYRSAIDVPGLSHPAPASDVEHAFHLYVVSSPVRDALARYLRTEGIRTAVHYPVPIHRQPGYAASCIVRPVSETDRACARVLSLPLHSTITPEQVTRVIDACNSFGRERGASE